MPEPSFTSSLSVWEPKTHLCQTDLEHSVEMVDSEALARDWPVLLDIHYGTNCVAGGIPLSAFDQGRASGGLAHSMGVGLKMQEESEEGSEVDSECGSVEEEEDLSEDEEEGQLPMGDSSSGVGTSSDPPVPGPSCSSFLEMSTSETNWLLGGVRRFLEKKLSTPPESDIVQQTYTFHKRQ